MQLTLFPATTSQDVCCEKAPQAESSLEPLLWSEPFWTREALLVFVLTVCSSAHFSCRPLQVLTECWKGALGRRRINGRSAIHAKKKKNPTLMGRRRLVQSVGSSSSVCRCVLVAVEVRLMSLQTFFTGGNVLHCHFTEVCSSHTNTHTPFLRLNTCWQAYYH